MLENPTQPSQPKQPERKHGELVAKRNTALVKDGKVKKLVKLFLAEDVDDVGEYLVKDLIIPGMKDVFFNFLWAVFWGDRRVSGGSGKLDGNRTKYSSSGTARISNRSSIPRRSAETEKEETAKPLNGLNLDNLIFDSKAQALDVLGAMREYLAQYSDNGVPVGYLMECVGETGDWASEYYGWTNLDEARIRPMNGGAWKLVLPRPQRLR